MSDRRKYDMNFLGSEAPAQGIKKASLSGHKCDFTLSMENESSAHAKAVYVQLANGFAIPSIYWILHCYYGLDLESNPGHTIHSSLVIVLPTIILGYSLLRLHPKSCPIWRAIGRGLLSIPLGALVAAFIGTALGAPIGIKYVMQTSYWALLVSTLMVAPAATVLGNSFYDWQRIFAFTRPNGAVELSICVPAHGAAIGAWIGAWPMPLDWDRPWQEWPICCTYGLLSGYLVGIIVSLVLATILGKEKRG